MIYCDAIVLSEKFEAKKPVEFCGYMQAVNYRTGTERHWHRITHVLIPDCSPGQELECEGSFEVTNDLQTNVELSACLVLSPHPSGTAGVELLDSVTNGVEPSAGRFITPCDGFNVTPNQHHARFPLHRLSFTIPEGFSGDQYVAIIAYAAADNYWPTTDVIKVEPMTGYLDVRRSSSGRA